MNYNVVRAHPVIGNIFHISYAAYEELMYLEWQVSYTMHRMRVYRSYHGVLPLPSTAAHTRRHHDRTESRKANDFIM